MRIHAGAVGVWITDPFPEVRRWVALEEEDEEKEEAVDLCEGDVGVEDVALSSHDGETHEHDANASLDGHVGNDEERFA